MPGRSGEWTDGDPRQAAGVRQIPGDGKISVTTGQTLPDVAWPRGGQALLPVTP
jgi:hypothetical protein